MTEPQSIELVRTVYRHMAADDIDALMLMLTDDAEWRNPTDAMEAGTRRGRDEVAVALGNLLDMFDIEELVIERWATKDDQVLASVATIGTGKVSGAPIGGQVFVHHFVLAGQKLRQFEWCRDWDSGAKLAGFDPDKWETSE